MDITETTHISLCSGYGGIDIGIRRVLPDVRTIAYVEIEAFACANLVEKMESQQLDEAPIWSNLKSFDARPFQGKVDILSGGFPCQPFSAAGQRKGTDDPRHLFPDIERIILECTPNIVFLENVEGIISAKYAGEENTSVLKYVLERLEEMGYTATAGVFSAEELSAPHRRKRVLICGVSNSSCELGNTAGDRCDTGKSNKDTRAKERGVEKGGLQEFEGGCCELANSDCDGSYSKEGHAAKQNSKQPQDGVSERGSCSPCQFPSRPNEPQHGWEYPRTIGDEETVSAMGGSTHGTANGNILRSCRVDALRLLGNGVVPVVAAKAFVVLMARINEGVTMK